MSAEEGAAVAPDGGRGVRLGHFGGVPGVPEGLGGLHFLVSGVEGEGRFVLRHGVAQLFDNGRGTPAGQRAEGRGGDVFKGKADTHG